MRKKRCSGNGLGDIKLFTNNPKFDLNRYGADVKRLHALIDDTDSDNKDVHNIAISGPKGSGKSSLVKTYLDTYRSRGNFFSKRKNGYVKVSLAAFDDNVRPDNEIECSVLQQIREYPKSCVNDDGGVILPSDP